MGLGGLTIFVVVMWAMILAVAAFLVIFVAPIDVIMFEGHAGRLTVSVVQAAIAIIAIVVLVFGLSRMKRIYMQKKLG
ncbi:MAG TPA: hypothetical protein VGQ13_03525 [Nitrososphaera sp.]|jgi:hypothetical protein|nr:hypothetical protein [Nitrososphaera sp.]